MIMSVNVTHPWTESDRIDMSLNETTLGENTKHPTTHRDSERIGVEKLGQRPKMSLNGEPLDAGLIVYILLYMRATQGYP